MAIANKIYIGSLSEPSYYFENDSILSANVVQNVSLVGQELSIDTFTATVQDDLNNLVDVYHFRSSDGKEIELAEGDIFALDVGTDPRVSDLINLDYETPVWYYQDNTLIGKFYVESVRRTGKNAYELNTVSAIGLLDTKMHGGGLFLASTFGAVLSHVLASGLHGTGDSVISYVIDDDVAALPVSCWLPYDTKRNNLYQLVFANGINILKNIDGNPRFTFIYTAPEQAQSIDSEAIYNEGDVEYIKPYEKVSVLEHTYTAVSGASSETLFDNSDAEQVTNKEVWFTNAPVIVSTVASDGLTIHSLTENSAIVSGSGTLTGVPYLHTTRAIVRGNENADEKKTISVSNCTAVNLINSENLLNRLFAFYCPEGFIKKIKNGIVYSEERCGKAYSLLNPFSEQETAFLTKMNINASSFNKADCEFYGEYEPAGQAGLYQHEDTIIPEPDPEDPEQEITEGDWTVPEDVTEFKVVLIGGGTGGGSGWPGKNGEDARTYTNIDETADLSAVWYGAEGGDGGAGGVGGSPGRVKVVTVSDAVPGTVYHWKLGKGGEGGAATGFIPDTLAELREALVNENPDNDYTDAQIEAMIAQEQTNWNGSPNAGSAGTATTFGTWSTADNDAYVPTGGVYDPIEDNYYALKGNTGIRGGKGGARKVTSGGSFNWVTDGEDVTGDDGEVYHGGGTGRSLTSVSGLGEASIIAYGGNGAGAAVGIDRATHGHINGGADQSTSWEVREDE